MFFLYLPLCLLVYRRLSPSLSPTSRRLAIGMLAAQVLVMVLSLAIRPTSLTQEWLWKLDAEWNIPSALASTQLALVGFVALFTAWLARASPVPDIPYQKFGYGIQPALVRFVSEEYLYGYHIERLDEAVGLRLYSYPWGSIDIGLGDSVHLVDQTSGGSVASLDYLLKRDRNFQLFGSYFVRVYAQEVELEFPPEAPANRALWVVLTLWRRRDDEYARQKVISSDLPLLGDSQVILGELVLPTVSAAPPTLPPAVFDGGVRLDAVGMPERAIAGETLEISFSWRSVESGGEDKVQYLHLGHQSPPVDGSVEGGAESAESDNWFVFDQQPLGPRLPTRL